MHPLFLVLPLLVPVPREPAAGELFERVAEVLLERFHDAEARASLIPALVDGLRPIANEARDGEEERAVVDALLAALDVSHCALYSSHARQMMQAELLGFEQPSLGFQLRVEDGEYLADWVFEGGVAERAGLVRGQRVVALDGVPVVRSPLLDWSTDDAALPDPPLHALRVTTGQAVRVDLADGRVLELVAERDSAWNATRRSARVVERDGVPIGVVHLWFVQVRGPGAFLNGLLDGEFADCAALVLDLRGRGGAAAEVENVLAALARAEERGLAVVALQDAGTRSAKEVIAHELRQRDLGRIVGEPSAGAVIPATFVPVGEDAVLMFPAFTLARYTELLEGRPVPPDVPVRDDVRSTPDEILEAGLRLAADLAAARGAAAR